MLSMGVLLRIFHLHSTVNIFPEKFILLPDHVTVPASLFGNRHGSGIEISEAAMICAFRHMGMTAQ